MKTRFVFATISSLALVFFLALQPVPSLGTPGTDGVAPGTDGGPGGDATAITPPNSDPSNTANATGGAGGAGGPFAFPINGGNGDRHHEHSRRRWQWIRQRK
jgi:hypothetical protein